MRGESVEMSVTAHYTEAFVLNRHFSSLLNFRWLIVGSAFPDAFIFDRLFMYTVDMKIHREYFFGWFHSLTVPLALAVLVYYLFGRRPALGFLVGSWLHVLTDVFDQLGVKLFWPLFDKRISVGIWPWADSTPWHDWFVYFTTPASGLFELFFLIWAILVIRRGKGRNFLDKTLQPWKASSWSEKPGTPSTKGMRIHKKEAGGSRFVCLILIGLLLSSSLIADTHKGANLQIVTFDGTTIRGELIAVRRNSIETLEPNATAKSGHLFGLDYIFLIK